MGGRSAGHSEPRCTRCLKGRFANKPAGCSRSKIPVVTEIITHYLSLRYGVVCTNFRYYPTDKYKSKVNSTAQSNTENDAGPGLLIFGGFEMFDFGETIRRAFTTLCCLASVTLFCASASAQHLTPATATNAKQFVGIWKASFQGNAFLTIALHIDGNKIVGTVSHANIELNNAGELTKAETNDGEDPDPIADLRVDGNILRITTKSTDGSENSIQAKLTLIAADDAELQMIVPSDVPAPKPWKLKRASA